MTMLYLTKRFHFSASHRVYNPEWSEEQNYKIYGKCSRIHGHGHNYVLEVTLAGEPDKQTGYLMDLKDLKDIVQRELIEKVDHTHLNYDVGFMQGINPTVENIITQFWKLIAAKLNGNQRKLYSLKLFESENNIAEYKGEDYE